MLQKLPKLEGIVVLNINSWSAGCCAWNDHSTSDQFGTSRWEMGREGGRCGEGEWEVRGGRVGDEEGEWEMRREGGR